MLAGEYFSGQVCCGVTVSGDDKACRSSLCEACSHRQAGLDTADALRFNSPRVPAEGILIQMEYSLVVFSSSPKL